MGALGKRKIKYLPTSPMKILLLVFELFHFSAYQLRQQLHNPLNFSTIDSLVPTRLALRVTYGNLSRGFPARRDQPLNFFR